MKYQSRHVDGVFLLNKSLDLSSNKALQDIKHLFRAKKAGHTGSLDPLATGLLPICLGEATKFSSYILQAEKSYDVTFKLGEQTSTADAEGEIIKTKAYDKSLSIEDLQHTADKMTGIIMQTPPMFSALKVKGIPLYELARQGKEVLRQARKVHLYDFKILGIDYPYVSAQLTCSSGFYVRTLAEDFAKLINTVSHVTKLHRTHVGQFYIENSLNYDSAKELSEAQRDSLIIPTERILHQNACFNLNEPQLTKIFQGQTILNLKGLPAKGFINLFYEQQFVGLGLVKEGRMISPKKLLSTQRISFFDQ